MKTDRLQIRMDYIEDRDKPYRNDTEGKINYTEDYVKWLEDKVVNNINYSQCCTELPTIEDANSEMYKVSNNLNTDHKQTEVNYYESGFLTCFYWLTKRLTK